MDVTLQGEYEPSAADWVRDQVEKYEASGGAEANILRGHPEWPIVVITSIGHKQRQAAQEPGDAGRARRRVRRGRLPRRRPDAPGVVPQLRRRTRRSTCRTVPSRTSTSPGIAEGAERAEWWERCVAQYAPYADYQEKTDREIPVFLLEPVA